MTLELILVKGGQLILSLSILVVLHELGHFIPAKLFKTRVEKFYLFFDPWFSLFKIKKGETEYGIGWLPLGGYVKISGMIDESMDKEQMAKPPQSWEFRAKPAWQRLIIMIGGVTVNILLAFFIYAMILWSNGYTYMPVKELPYGIQVDSLGKSIGLQDGDKIVSIDNKEVKEFEKIPVYMILHGSKTIQVDRNGQPVNVTVPDGFIRRVMGIMKGGGSFIAPYMPDTVPYVARHILEDGAGAKAGLKPADRMLAVNGVATPDVKSFLAEMKNQKSKTIDLQVLRGADTVTLHPVLDTTGKLNVLPYTAVTIPYNFFQSIPAGVKMGVDKLNSYVLQLRLLFVSKEVKVTESLGGFGSIAKLFPDQWNWLDFWQLTAFLSIILAFMNILPIPALDGGHVLFLLYEIITGRKPSEKFLEYAQIVGMVILLGLLLFANGLDIWRGIFGK
ncbi:RIP metalloprotease RseP [Chitinophaga sp. sic0106]|uniref:RIP metalloprotease RseP n=1 Tax=Chitinophaga sp. sic0106 TaxID=2854785 RepID=UPI001C461B48|nr:RIP metalloprotease RseP [Chitinophaga sp. sic0106]MBV7531304.1 RIP metalloprotease RseP [Chitinophaga sp. sic0106]